MQPSACCWQRSNQALCSSQTLAVSIHLKTKHYCISSSYTIFEKAKHEIEGIVYKCTIEHIRIFTDVGFFGAYSTETQRDFIPVGRELCIRMVEDHLCGTNVMTCSHKACKYNKMPNYFHEWPKRPSLKLNSVRSLAKRTFDGNFC